MNSRKNSCIDCSHKLSGDSLFCCLTLEQLTNLSNTLRCLNYNKGQIIFNEGNQPYGLYCIKHGKVKISKLGDEGKEQIVRLAKDASLVGYRSVLSGSSYYATATALEDTEVCYIPKSVIIDLIKENYQFSLTLMNLLSDDLKRAENKITNMAQKHVRERIAETILLLKECYGLKDDNQSIDAYLTRRDIANIAGTSTETSIRILSELNKDGIIELKDKNIKILDTNLLIKTANIFD
ncbi:MAG: Crp/Fnr family transcriptional regulator [Flavobacteriales bacterium]|nr:Crp/Fnr family transcriptional regulator [Flavobacteriales bacterium]